MKTTTAYLCLGSNIKPEDNIRFAIEQLKQNFDVLIASNVYRSRAVGFVGDDFLNVVIELKTDYTLGELLFYADSLEQDAGRTRERRGNYDSRTLDVDVIMFGDLVGEHKGRQWPSDDIQNNAHVLLPMSEIAGHKKHPTLGIKFDQLWKEFDRGNQSLKQVKSIC